MPSTVPTYPDNNTARQAVRSIVQGIAPYDDLEQARISEVLVWVDSGAAIFRIAKPDVPNIHLGCMFALFDKSTQKILLTEHKKAECWIPAGGHVEINENPQHTVVRECLEELNVPAEFLIEAPLFMTLDSVVGGVHGHKDANLWYVLRGDSSQSYTFDSREFNSVQWFDIDNLPHERCDPRTRRFVDKLKQYVRGSK